MSGIPFFMIMPCIQGVIPVLFQAGQMKSDGHEACEFPFRAIKSPEDLNELTQALYLVSNRTGDRDVQLSQIRKTEDRPAPQ